MNCISLYVFLIVFISAFKIFHTFNLIMAREWDSDQNDHMTFLMIFLSPMIHDTFVLWVIVNTEASLGRYLVNTIHRNAVQEVFLTTMPLILPLCFSRTCSMASWRVGKKMEVWTSSSKNMQLCSFSMMYTVNPWAACYGFSQAVFH